MNKFVKSLKWEWRMNRAAAIAIVALTAAALLSYGLYYNNAEQLMHMDHSNYMDPLYQRLYDGMFSWETWLQRFAYLAAGLAIFNGGIAMYRRLSGDRRHLNEINPTDNRARFAAEFLFHLLFIVVTVTLLVAYRKMNYIKYDNLNTSSTFNHGAIPAYFLELLPQVLLTTAAYLAAGWMATAFCARLYSNKLVKLALSAIMGAALVILVYYVKAFLMDAIWPLYTLYFTPQYTSSGVIGFFAFIGHVRNDVGGIGQAGRLVEAGYALLVMALCILGNLYMTRTTHKPFRNARAVQVSLAAVAVLAVIMLPISIRPGSLYFNAFDYVRSDKATMNEYYDEHKLDSLGVAVDPHGGSQVRDEQYYYTPKAGANQEFATLVQANYTHSIPDMEYYRWMYSDEDHAVPQGFDDRVFSVSAKRGLVDESSSDSAPDSDAKKVDMAFEYRPGLFSFTVTYKDGHTEEYIDKGNGQYMILSFEVDGEMKQMEFHPDVVY